jgi:hypothetical protein
MVVQRLTKISAGPNTKFFGDVVFLKPAKGPYLKIA